MHYLWQHLEHILATYDGKLPLHHFLKSYFKNHPKLGSRDRRGLSDAVYAWYRAGKALKGDAHDLQLKRLAAMQLCGLRPKAFASFFPGDWGNPGGTGTSGLPSFLLRAEDIFPYDITFSEGITFLDWCMSLLHQSRLFLRIRRNHDEVEDTLLSNNLPHKWLSPSCLALPNGTRLEGILPENAYVVQDASSQATGTHLHGNAGEQWWDCCAGAGGKSLMLADASPGVQLLATDMRESILKNLAARFRQYNLPFPERGVLDSSNAAAVASTVGNRLFEGIICDVPCTGSGTWARTPEACYFFNPKALVKYSNRQKAILRNAAKYISSSGRIVYITCSVFREENEDVVAAVAPDVGLVVESSSLINGIPIGADSMFVSVLRKAFP